MSSKWIQHCKAYAKKHGCTYGEAMSLARPSYHSNKKESGAKKAPKKGKAILVPKKKKKGGNMITFGNVKPVERVSAKKMQKLEREALGDKVNQKNQYELNMTELMELMPKLRP